MAKLPCRSRMRIRDGFRNRFAVGGLPTPGTGPIAACHHTLPVDLRDDVPVSGKQGFGGTHFRAKWQLAFGKTIGAIFHIFGHREIGLRPARAIGAFVHLAARSEIGDARILRRSEWTGVEAIAATNAKVL